MSNPYLRNSDLNLLHPVVRSAAILVQNELNAEGIPFKVFEAYRSPERQADLFAQGRTKPGSIVTHAEPWRSYHQFGLAVDFVLFIDGKWSWGDHGQDKKKWWARMHELGLKNGLSPLNFEAPHLQISGTSSNALSQGHYPAGGDDLWAEHLAATIASWKGAPLAPPSPQVPGRPSII
jgi:peptidoglycan L-alanyl-D-glutamate endopeptidase CwlK